MGLFDKLFKGNTTSSCDNEEDLNIVKGTGAGDNDCGCGDGCVCEESCSSIAPSTSESNLLTIKILGSGCKNCVTLTENVKIALDELKIAANIVKVTDLNDIAGYGIMSTPALVINEKVASYGKVLKPKEVVKILEKVLGE